MAIGSPDVWLDACTACARNAKVRMGWLRNPSPRRSSGQNTAGSSNNQLN